MTVLADAGRDDCAPDGGANATLRVRAAAAADTPTASTPEHEAYRLVTMLMRGAIERIQLAQHCRERLDETGRLAAIASALTLIDGLRLTLDHSAGGEIAAGLETLYLHATARLAVGDRDALQEVAALLHDIAASWAAVPTTPSARADRAGSARVPQSSESSP